MFHCKFGDFRVVRLSEILYLCYVLKHIGSTLKDNLYTLLPEFWEDKDEV